VTPIPVVAAPPIALQGPSAPAAPVAAMPVAAPPVAAMPVAAPPAGRIPTTMAPAGRTVVATVAPQAGRTIVAPAGPRAPLVGMQEQPTGAGVSATLERELATAPRGRAPEVYMPTLPTIDAARAHGENPLDSAMMRALSKRPADVTPGRKRTTDEFETPPPSFATFEGASEDDTTKALDTLDPGEREKK
jgi:hypothetical protein